MGKVGAELSKGETAVLRTWKRSPNPPQCHEVTYSIPLLTTPRSKTRCRVLPTSPPSAPNHQFGATLSTRGGNLVALSFTLTTWLFPLSLIKIKATKQEWTFHWEMRSCKMRRPYLGAAFWERHGVTGSKPRGEQWKSSAVYKMTCEGRGKNQGCLVSRKQLRSHNSLQICKRERITGLVLQEGREFLFAKHVNWEVKHRHRPRRGLWNLPQWHFLRINCKSWGVNPFAGWGWTRWPLKHPLNLKLRVTVVRKSVFTDSWCSNSLQKERRLFS